jgi:AhpD family alkylhydroperoxidase
VFIRASQLNRCAYCLDLHTGRALRLEDDPLRLVGLVAWRENPAFTARERAALAWTESLTLLPDSGAPDDVHAGLTAVFDEKEIVNLTLAVALINAWNRLYAGLRVPPGAK